MGRLCRIYGPPADAGVEDVSLRKHARSASCGGDGVGGAPEGSHAEAPAFIPFEESSMPCEGVAGSSSEAQADGSRGRAGAPRAREEV
jgi:hypothetical protein